MDGISILLCDEDEKFSEYLSLSLGSYDGKLSCKGVSSEVFEAAFEGGTFDFYLLGESFYKEKEKNYYFKKGSYGILTSNYEEKEDEIFKYVSVEEMIAAIKNILGERQMGGKRIPKKDLFLFYSAKGGCGKTSVAAGVTKALAISGKKSLYVNLENFASLFCKDCEKDGKNLTQLIYHYFYGRGKDVMSGIENFMGIDDYGAYGLRMSEIKNEISALNKDQKNQFLFSFMEETDFECICFDVGESLFLLEEDFLHRMSQFIFVYDESMEATLKNDAVFQILKERKIEKEVIGVWNKYKQGHKKECEFIFSWDPGALNAVEEIININMNSKFGAELLKFSQYLITL